MKDEKDEKAEEGKPDDRKPDDRKPDDRKPDGLTPLLIRLGELRKALGLGKIRGLWDYVLPDGWRIVLNGEREPLPEPADLLVDPAPRPTNCGWGVVLPFRAAFYHHGRWTLECDCALGSGFVEPVFDFETAAVVDDVLQKEIRRLGGTPCPFRWAVDPRKGRN